MKDNFYIIQVRVHWSEMSEKYYQKSLFSRWPINEAKKWTEDKE